MANKTRNGMLINQTTGAQVVEGGASSAHIGEVGAYGAGISDTFTRPADTTAYLIGDVIAATISNTATTPLRSLALARVAGEPFNIRGVSVATNKTDFLATLRVHFYSVADPAAAPNSGTALVGDNIPFVQTYNNILTRIGYVDLPALALQHTAGDNYTIASAADDKLVKPAAGTGFPSGAASLLVFYRLEITGGASITPISGQSFTTRVWVS